MRQRALSRAQNKKIKRSLCVGPPLFPMGVGGVVRGRAGWADRLR